MPGEGVYKRMDPNDAENVRRRFRAQERYAQDVVDYLWEEGHTELAPEGQKYYRGSIHQLIRKVQPKAQAGDVVNVLRQSGAVVQAAYGVWEVTRERVFFEADGTPIEFTAPTYGHDTKDMVHTRQFQELNRRMEDLEKQVEGLTELYLIASGQMEGREEDKNTA